MGTIKSYTDIEQSKKLAKILPLESADMNWHELPSTEFFARAFPYKHDHGATEGIFPCWSLAALLELLPKRLQIVDNVYELSVYLYGLYYWNITNGNPCFESKDKDNLVDACYEAIVFLHEQKLL